jgi:hypothetical protein
MKLKLMLGLLASAMIITQCDQANQEDSVAGTEESSVTSTVLSSGSSTQDSEYVNVKASVNEESLNLSSDLEDFLIEADCGDDGKHYLDKNNSVAKIRVGSDCSTVALKLLVIAGKHIENPDGKDNITVSGDSSGLGSITADSKFGFTFSQTGSGSASASAKEARYTNLERDITLSENVGESAYRLDLVGKSFSDVVMSTQDSSGILKSFKVAARGEDGIGDGVVSSDGHLTGSGATDGLAVTSNVGSVGVSPHPDPSQCGELSNGDQCYELSVSASGTALLDSACTSGSAKKIYLVFIRDDDADSNIQSATKLKVDVCK